MPHCPSRERLIHFLVCQLIFCFVWYAELTSIANKTPPMGEPNATATPAALDAVTISLILAWYISGVASPVETTELTMTLIVPPEHPSDDISKTTSDVDRWSFFAHRET